jgi:GNAT superfamily N-acetyltransferase
VDHRHRMWAEIGGRTPRQLAVHDGVYRRWILPRLRSGEVTVILMEEPGRRVIASGGIWFRPEQPRPGAPRSSVPYLFSMYTEPEFRRRGLAQRIVREAVRICRARGYRRVVLHAAPHGRPLYQGLGFQRAWEMRLDFRR